TGDRTGGRVGRAGEITAGVAHADCRRELADGEAPRDVRRGIIEVGVTGLGRRDGGGAGPDDVDGPHFRDWVLADAGDGVVAAGKAYRQTGSRRRADREVGVAVDLVCQGAEGDGLLLPLVGADVHDAQAVGVARQATLIEER